MDAAAQIHVSSDARSEDLAEFLALPHFVADIRPRPAHPRDRCRADREAAGRVPATVRIRTGDKVSITEAGPVAAARVEGLFADRRREDAPLSSMSLLTKCDVCPDFWDLKVIRIRCKKG